MPKAVKSSQKSAIPRGQGIYFLPTSITLSSLFAGFYGIVAASNLDFAVAPIAIFVAMLLDGLDGRIARATNTQSRFGAELDSLTDMVVSGVAPCMVVYFWSLRSLGKMGWLIAFLYLACVLLRLARFNAKSQNGDKRYFQGLPSPGGAGIVAGLVYFCYDKAIYGPDLRIVAAVITTFAALMMVSSIPYRSFKDFNPREQVPFIAVAMACVLFVFFMVNPSSVLFVAFLGYGLYGPVLRCWAILRKRLAKKKR